MKMIRRRILSVLASVCLLAGSSAVFAAPVSAKELTGVIEENTNYYIRNASTGKYLTATELLAGPNAAVVMKDLDRNNNLQKFQLRYVYDALQPSDGGVYTIYSAANKNFFVSTDYTSTNPMGKGVFISSSKFSQWCIRQYNGGISISPDIYYSAKMVDNSGAYTGSMPNYYQSDGVVYIDDFGSNGNNTWELVKESSLPAIHPLAGVHTIKAENSMYLWPDSTYINYGTKVVGKAGPVVQNWELIWVAGDTFKIRVQGTGYYINFSDLNNIKLSGESDGCLVNISGYGDGRYIIPFYPVEGEGQLYTLQMGADGTLSIAPFSYSANQLWTIV